MKNTDVQELFIYMSNEHDVILLDQDIAEIENICNRELIEVIKRLKENNSERQLKIQQLLDEIKQIRNEKHPEKDLFTSRR